MALIFSLGALAVTSLAARPPPPSLDVLVRGRRHASGSPGDVGDVIDRLGHLTARLPVSDRLLRGNLDKDLAVVRRSYEQFLGVKVGLAAAALFAVGPVAVIAHFLGLGVAATLPTGAAIAVCIGAFFVPDYVLAREAEEERAHVRAATSAFTRLAVQGLRAVDGPTTAVLNAASHIDGWFGNELSAALREAALNSRAPWDAIEALGDRLGIADLCYVGATLRQAGTDGASIAGSLDAVAESLSDRALAERKAAIAPVNAKLVTREVGIAFCVVGLVMAPLIAGIRP